MDRNRQKQTEREGIGQKQTERTETDINRQNRIETDGHRQIKTETNRCHMSHVTNANSDSHRPSHCLLPHYAHCTLGWFKKTQNPKYFITGKIIGAVQKNIFWLANISNTLFNQKYPFQWEAGFPGGATYGKRTLQPIDWISLRAIAVKRLSIFCHTQGPKLCGIGEFDQYKRAPKIHDQRQKSRNWPTYWAIPQKWKCHMRQRARHVRVNFLGPGKMLNMSHLFLSVY